MSLVEQSVEVDLSEDDARALVNRIRQMTEIVWTNVVKLYKGRGWVALGYSSWDECCDAEFDGARIKLPREERREVVATLSEEGMSTRAIAAATGASVGSVHADKVFSSEHLSGDASASSDPETPPGDTDPDDDIVDAEIVDEPSLTIGIDGKTYQRPAPTPVSVEEQRRREAEAARIEAIDKNRKNLFTFVMTFDGLNLGDDYFTAYNTAADEHDLPRLALTADQVRGAANTLHEIANQWEKSNA